MKYNEHFYRELTSVFIEKQERELKMYINELLDKIKKGINECGGLIHFGNVNLFVRDGEVYSYCGFSAYDEANTKHYSEAVKLYSEDGWENPADIGNWVDVVENYLKEVRQTKPGMTRSQILNEISGLARSQGFYGRLLESISKDEDYLNYLENLNFQTTLDMIEFFES